MGAMAALVSQHKIRAIGVSNFSVPQMRRAHTALARLGFPLASNQVRYNLLERGIEVDGMIAAARELGVSIIAHSPLEQGLLTGKYHQGRNGLPARTFPFSKKTIERTTTLMHTLRAIAQSHSATTAQVALAWLTQFHGEVVVAIPGAKSTRQASENGEALDIRLSSIELAVIDNLSRRLS